MNLLYCFLVSLFLSLSTEQTMAQMSLLPDSLTSAPDSIKTWKLRQIGDSLIFAIDYPLAKQAYDQALSIAQATGNKADIGFGYRGVGYWYQNIGDFTRAVKYYQQALSLFRQINYTKEIPKTMSYISFCYVQLGNDKQAEHYTQQGLKLAEADGQTKWVIAFYEELAKINGHKKRFAKAEQYTNRVLAYYVKQKDSLSYHIALLNASLLYKNRGQYGRSERSFRDVLQFSQAPGGDETLYGYALVNIPSALIPQGKLAEAEMFCRQALAWVDKTGANKLPMQEEIYGHLYHIAEARGDYRQALAYYRQQIARRDSLQNETVKRQLSEQEIRFQTEEKEAQIRQLDLQNIIRSRQVWAGVGGIVLLSLLAGVLYLQSQQLRKSQAKIQAQSNQMALMMRELHHRVKNNLAVVSSLLRLQSTRLEDEKAMQAVRTGQQRVEAMSLIHQKLYQTDNVTRVNMRDYLRSLAESLLIAYGYQLSEVDLQVDVEVEELEVDVTIPLGLIANELITNAFKYAYSGNRHPALYIRLRNHNGITLDVFDNGPGMPAADWLQTEKGTSFGKRLIFLLAEQLEGKVELIQQNGTLFRLHIPYESATS
ncbi:histidine kinase dimerization/phosphoacceptor domain -containing protein [Spirosoma sp. KUDC1026]|uniref:histidine kinase dimerization/phosphoacceptor domain -containing protein n=1 Tax=Spirosoma sp. KUDC1026 TaxID=2745947 RepID=UPI00159B92C6|nr:histidine kinase dimerization/phosphoacceptor domain -containing protein [Spirosoma sp. KUDC1026]QKZ12584.1 tetratricopeptide repeat protein [Spirosoma sp. KUDC1026]